MIPLSVPAFERYRDIIPDYEAFRESLNCPPATFLRVNTLKVDVESFRSEMTKYGNRLEPVQGIEEAFRLDGIKSPGTMLEYFLGHYQVQGLTSMLPPRILGPQPGELILDLCAAPGGKTTYLAQLMGNRGLIVANDVRAERIGILRFHLDRLGIVAVAITRYPGEAFPGGMTFQRILVDPPCSGEGTYWLGSKPPVSKDSNAAGRLRKLQRSILRRAFDLLRPGGTLVYSTCTYAPEENEAVVNGVLAEGQAELLPITLPLPHSQGLISWEEMDFSSEMLKTIRVYPHQVNSWGFFIAHLRKRV